MAKTRLQLINLAIIVCAITILSNIVEGVLSLILGSQSNSVSLIIFGIGSFVEMTSASLVLGRFVVELRKSIQIEEAIVDKTTFIDIERKTTLGIGLLFLVLASGTFLHAIISLSQRSHPENTIAGLIISSVSIVCMLAVYIAKRYLAAKLDSSSLASEAQCSLACIKITGVLFVSSLIYMIWENIWWVDSVAALIFSTFFAKEGYVMINWASSEYFTDIKTEEGRSDNDINEKKAVVQDEKDIIKCVAPVRWGHRSNSFKHDKSINETVHTTNLLKAC
ncbi:203_t:CDS:2 [Diversispora eburnea]|uniref:203_t:CDS:1 n=1 Tax=Diversispora eburnea TaxID=1213867 RepID=A0A9N8WAN0_9GLOM|nr:203_t:CDS:2 [Diversispora eburnea]